VLSTFKNLVTGLANLTETYLNVNGTSSAANITVPTVIKAAAGRVVAVSVLVAGSTPGTIYDGATLGAITRPLYPIPNTVGVFPVNLVAQYGILVAPGGAQAVTVGYS
jgi:hypothetical protein